MVVTDCLKGHLLLHGVTNVDDVVSDDAEADPAGYSDVAIVAAATSPFDDADAPFASDGPLLAITEQALFSARGCVLGFWSAVGSRFQTAIWRKASPVMLEMMTRPSIVWQPVLLAASIARSHLLRSSVSAEAPCAPFQTRYR